MKQDSNENMTLCESPFPSFPSPGAPHHFSCLPLSRHVCSSPTERDPATTPDPPTLSLALFFSVSLRDGSIQLLCAQTRSQSTVPLAWEPLTTGGETGERTPSFGTLTKKIEKHAQRDVQQQQPLKNLSESLV